MKVRNCTIGELFSVPSQGSLFATQKVVQLRTFKVVQFLTSILLYVFPYLGLIGPFLKNQKLIESQVGTSVVHFLARLVGRPDA